MNEVSRRRFLQVSSGMAVGAGLGLAATRTRVASAAVSANEKIVVGFVGVGGRGSGLLGNFTAEKDVEVGAICDAHKPRLDAVLAKVGGKAKGYSDFRKLLEQKDLDAVVIATPPHWHPLISIYACQAGKDVYCEKPMCLKPVEGRAMKKAAAENKRVTQIGTQIHADENYHRVVEIVRSGVLGELSAVRTQLMLNEAPNGITGNPPDEPPPAGLDWDMWCGPLPLLPYNKARFTLHRYFGELVGSWLHEMGPHIVDLPFWALELGPPKSVVAMGGKFATHDISTIPDTMEAVFEFDKFIMIWSNMCANGFGLATGKTGDRQLLVSFHGVDGTLMADYDTYKFVAEPGKPENPTLPDPYLSRSPGHQREFLDCVKSRQACSCSFDYHYNVHVALNLGNAAYRLGRKLVWDEERGDVVGDKEASEALQANYRAPWSLPV